MSLKYVVDSVDGLSTDIAALYTPNADGKFYLEVEGAVSKTKLDEFRNNNITLTKTLEKYKDVDLSTYSELLGLKKQTDEKKLIDAGELDKVVEQRVGEMRTTYTSQIETLQQENTVAKRQLESLLIDSTVRDAAMQSGVQPTAVEDVLLRAKTVFQIKDGQSVPMDKSGAVIYGKDGSTPMSVNDWVANLKKQAPHLFLGSSGGGAAGSRSPAGADTSKLSSTQKITAGLDSLIG
jgi:hypothetical protein